MYINRKMPLVKTSVALSLSLMFAAGCSNTPVSLGSQQVNEGELVPTEDKDGMTHTHNGVPHTHPLPATGLNHTHNYNTKPATSGVTPANNNRPPVTTFRPPVVRPPVTRPATPQLPAGHVSHSHNGRTHAHPLPASGVNHNHNMGGQTARASVQPQRPATPSNYMAQPPRPAPRPQQPVRTQTYNYSNYGAGANQVDTNVNYVDYTKPKAPVSTQAPAPAPVPPVMSPPKQPAPGSFYDYGTVSSVKKTGSIAHKHGGKVHSHVLPAAGVNHRHNIGSALSDTYRQYAMGGQDPAATSTYTQKTTPSYNSSSSSGGGSTYIVKKGDTVFQVMRNTGVYWKDIIRMNNLQAPGYTIHPGQQLRLK